ncbi:MAG: saccharopine dehydrogenase NADP-binding domain-containing protein [Candidatus Nanopelagicales bacterium]|nr:saccharopine dehydrogenase NADP-binding domain-containing protein [Candidatus Nanopelagicales bacterium]
MTSNPQTNAADIGSQSGREFDVVVYGASGFVGRLVAEYLAKHAPAGTKIGLAGRSERRLSEVRAGLPAAARDWPILIADAHDGAALRAMAARTTAIATTVGPYIRYGFDLAAACAETGTHCADLTGEVLFARECIDQLDETARATGARLVNSCGFDSIPSDLSVLMAYEYARDHGLGELEEVTLYVMDMKGGLSGGTVDSARATAEKIRKHPELRKILRDPYSLSPDRAHEPSGSSPATTTLAYSREVGGWVGPFIMAEHNVRVVRRSNALFDWAYGRNFRYREVVRHGPGPLAPAAAIGTAVGLRGIFIGMALSPTRAVLDRMLPAPGEGPSREQREAGRFLIEVRAGTSSGNTVVVRFGARADPGYLATSIMLGESALCLALDGLRLPNRSGVLTPATAMGDPLVDRLRAAGFEATTKVIRRAP